MKQVDYLIVGCGLAGIAFSHMLEKHGKSFIVVDDSSQQSSTVAGGLYNPVVLKRFTPVWKSEEQLNIALPVYEELEDKLQVKLDYKTPVYRLFNSVAEQNNWFQATDHPELSKYLYPHISYLKNSAIDSSFGYGLVHETGRVDTAQLIRSYRAYLKQKDMFLEVSFKPEDLNLNVAGCEFGDILASRVIFCEGFGLKHNPYFNYLPLNGTKGELITIHAPELQIEFVLKSSVFLIPLGDDIYRVGSTYEWEDKTNTITNKGKEELLTKLDGFLKCDYKVIDQVAGIRRTVKDRRPLVGQHGQHKQLFVLNGLGTRGVMIAPYVAEQLFHHIEYQTPLNKEIDIRRFEATS